MIGINFIAGKLYRAWGKFDLEVYAGLGVRFISIESSNLEIDHTKDIIKRSPDLNIPDNRIWMDVTGGETVLGNFSFGIRFCYSFK